MANLRIYACLLILVLLFLSHPAFAQKNSKAPPAKLVQISIAQPSPNLTRITLKLTGNAFHYQWRFVSNAKQKQLNVMIQNAALATRAPRLNLANTPISSYTAKPHTDKNPLVLQFQLKAPVDVKTYILPPPAAHRETTLIVELKPLNGAASAIVTPKPSSKIPPPKKQAEKKIATIAAELTTTPDPPARNKTPITSKRKRNRPVMVVIDPGHGGKDSGAVGSGNTREKDVVLAISKILQQAFRQQPGFAAELTRSQDVFISLRQRLEIARRCKADIFIAIHADAAYQNQSAIGASVFALSERGATSEGARWLAQKENESELVHGIIVDKDQMLRSVLLDLSQTHTIAVSLSMGQFILNRLSTITRLHYARVEQAAFVVLKSPDTPSLLVETGYISNPTQEAKLRDPAYQRQLANAIVQGVVAYFAVHPPQNN